MHIADPWQVPSTVFMYTLHLDRPSKRTDGATPAEQALAGEHWAYSQQLLARKIIVFGGRTLARGEDGFATVIIRAESMEAARAIMEADPAVAGGLFRAQLYPYQPMLMGTWPSDVTTVSPPGHVV